MKNKKILIRILLFILALGLIFVLYWQRTYATNVSQERLVDLANRERITAGLKPLTIDPELSLAASNKAQDMILAQYFDHYSPNGLTPWNFILSSGYNYIYAGENLAMDFHNSEAIHNAWMQSPTHQANILNPKYENIGVAVTEGYFDGHNTKMVVQMFGKRKEPILESFNSLVSKIKTWLLGIEEI